MSHRVCPWWGGYFIDNPLRRLIHNPDKIIEPYVKAGMTVLDIGCGMGLFSIAMAKVVGDQGRVISVDLQPQMLAALKRRAERAGVAGRIQLHRCEANDLKIDVTADFALAFAMVHETPDMQRLLSQAHDCLRSGGKFLIAEPRFHVPGAQFDAMIATAEQLGFAIADRPPLRLSLTVLLERTV
jgi:FkbM family methyltransferase